MTSGGPRSQHTAMPASELVGVRTREALRQFVLGLARLGRPVVMVVEDLHWIDAASQTVLDEIVKTATDEPLLLLCSFRPQFQPVWTLAVEDLRLSASDQRDRHRDHQGAAGGPVAAGRARQARRRQVRGQPAFRRRVRPISVAEGRPARARGRRHLHGHARPRRHPDQPRKPHHGPRAPARTGHDLALAGCLGARTTISR